MKLSPRKLEYPNKAAVQAVSPPVGHTAPLASGVVKKQAFQAAFSWREWSREALRKGKRITSAGAKLSKSKQHSLSPKEMKGHSYHCSLAFLNPATQPFVATCGFLSCISNTTWKDQLCLSPLVYGRLLQATYPTFLQPTPQMVCSVMS